MQTSVAIPFTCSLYCNDYSFRCDDHQLGGSNVRERERDVRSDLAERRLRAWRVLRTTDGRLLPFRSNRPVQYWLRLDSSGTVDYIWLQNGTSVSYSFTIPSSATFAYGIPAGGYLNNAAASVSIDGSTPVTVDSNLGASGSTTSNDLYLWTDTLGAGTHTWTVTSQGNAVKVYGLWITTSATPLCSTSNGQPWLSISPASVSGLEASINGGVIAPQGTSLTGIDWNWGDGTVLIGCVYFPESHTYHQTGEYTVVVTTTFTNGTKLQASENVTVVSANSSGANLNGADLSGANLTDANLSGANLNKAGGCPEFRRTSVAAR